MSTHTNMRRECQCDADYMSNISLLFCITDTPTLLYCDFFAICSVAFLVRS